VDRKRINVVTIWLDDAVHEAILDSQDNRHFRPTVELCRPKFRVVDLRKRSEMDDRRCTTMHFGSFPNNARSRSIRHLRRLAEKRIELIASVELSEPVDLEVAVDTVNSFAILVDVDAGGKNELYPYD
jgi:hypothetical protein